MKIAPTLLAAAATVLVVPLLTGYAAQPQDPAPLRLASALDATTITQLAEQGVELTADDAAESTRAAALARESAVQVAARAVGGVPRAAVLDAFTDHGSWDPATQAPLSRRAGWHVVLDGTVLPTGERGRAWVLIDPRSGEVLAARPLAADPPG